MFFGEIQEPIFYDTLGDSLGLWAFALEETLFKICSNCPKWCEAGVRGSPGKGHPRGLVEEVGLGKDAGEALELEKDKRGKDLSKKLTSSSKEAEGRLKRKMGLEWPFQLDSSGSLNSMA